MSGWTKLRRRRVRAVVAILVLGWSSAYAQEPGDPSDGARVRLGNFAFTPAVWSTAGYDSNFDGESGKPKGDYVVVGVPQLETWLNIGRVQFATVSILEFFAYRELEPGRVFVHFNSLALGVPGARLEPVATYSHRNKFARPTGFEIGARSRRIEDEAVGGLNWLVTEKTRLSVRARQVVTAYDASARYQGSNLRESLNRTTTAGSMEAVVAVTPLTSISASVERSTDRFKFSTRRDGDSLQTGLGVSFASPALITGAAYVGYRRFRSPYSTNLNFDGVVTSVQLGYVRESRTRLYLHLDRQPFFAHAESLGYYLLNSGGAGYVQSLSRDWEASAFAAYRLLDYVRPQEFSGASPRTTRWDVGSGLSCRVGAFTRLGVNFERTTSRGPTAFREWRLIGYVVYGTDRLQRLENPIPDERR